MNRFLQLVGYNCVENTSTASNNTNNNRVQVKPRSDHRQIQKTHNTLTPNNNNREYTENSTESESEEDDNSSDSSADKVVNKRDRKGTNLKRKSKFTQDIIDNVIGAINFSENLKQRDTGRQSMNTIAQSNGIKLEELKLIKKLSKDYDNKLVYKHLDHMKIG